METLNSTINWFIGHCANHRKLSIHTLKAYRHDLKIFSNFMSKSTNTDEAAPTSSVNKQSVQNWLADMCNVKPRTIRRRLATVKSMFSALERQGGIADDPLARFRSEIKVGSSLPRIIARSTVRSLLRSPRKQAAVALPSRSRLMQESTLLEMLFSTGMRVSEVCGLDIKEVDMDRQVISVHGKGNREREIPIVCSAFQDALEMQITWRHQNGGFARYAPVRESARRKIVRPIHSCDSSPARKTHRSKAGDTAYASPHHSHPAFGGWS